MSDLSDHCERPETCHCGRCDCHTDGHDAIAAKMLHLAKCAKHSLLKQKIERQLEAKIGAQLDRIADLAATALVDRMQHMSSGIQADRAFEDGLIAAMTSG